MSIFHMMISGWQRFLRGFVVSPPRHTLIEDVCDTYRIAAGLQRIRKDKLRHREEFRHMMMKSDPSAILLPRPLQADEMQQKQAWLEQCKNNWLNQERTAWQAGGKQTPWAE